MLHANDAQAPLAKRIPHALTRCAEAVLERAERALIESFQRLGLGLRASAQTLGGVGARFGGSDTRLCSDGTRLGGGGMRLR